MGVSFLEDFATDHSAPVQAICARLLAADDTQASVDELANALGDKSWVVRAAAARALARMHQHPHIIPQLRDMLAKDKSRPARFAAAAAIIQLSPPVKTLRLPKPAAEKVNSSAMPASGN
jgi:HEAT repeat protein